MSSLGAWRAYSQPHYYYFYMYNFRIYNRILVSFQICSYCNTTTLQDCGAVSSWYYAWQHTASSSALADTQSAAIRRYWWSLNLSKNGKLPMDNGMGDPLRSTVLMLRVSVHLNRELTMWKLGNPNLGMRRLDRIYSSLTRKYRDWMCWVKRIVYYCRAAANPSFVGGRQYQCR